MQCVPGSIVVSIRACHFHIPVCGTHLSGFVDVFANRKELKDAFTMQRLELELDDGGRFLMFDRLAAAEQDEKAATEKAKQTPTKRPRGR
uniref:Uncharacterized protein n=1 Tax=Globodera rostochiensis TaxID=31243 RepID=A0A914I863_GLORO